MTTRVISYIRFSTPRQRLGDSHRRQLEAASRWCEKKGLTLDLSFVLEDLGVSAYSGANKKKGALGVLTRMCLSGELEPGTILLIEAFDRLTRLALPEAYELLLSLINNGLTIVTLSDEKVWTSKSMSRLEEFMLSLSTLYRGHQESEYKSLRLREAFEAQRAQGSKQAFGSAPGWLYREHKSQPWLVHEDKAAVVRRVFELSAAGLGSKAIAGLANKEGWLVPTRLAKTGKRWHAQMPGLILRNRAVLGEHQHRIRTYEANESHWRGAPTEEVIPDFYPRIVSDDLWYRSRASIATRSVARRRDAHGYNIWSGLMFCGHCGAPLHRKQESRGQSKASIMCSDRLADASLACPTFSAADVDSVLLTQLFRIAPSNFGTSRGSAALAEIAALEVQEQKLVEQSANITEFIMKVGGSVDVDGLAARYVKVSDALARVRADIASLREAQVLTNEDYTLNEEFLAQAMNHLYVKGDESMLIRAELHLKLARQVACIWVWAYDLSIIEWKAGWQTVLPLRHKVLRSRANPSAKYHKPPKPRAVGEGGPFYALASAEDSGFEPPTPKIRNRVAGSAHYRDELYQVDDASSNATATPLKSQ